jgi:hypothetical protein
MKTLADFVTQPGISLPEGHMVFTGPPLALSAQLVLENTSSSLLQVGFVQFVQSESAGSHRIITDTIQVNAELAPGQKFERRVKLVMDRHTPPGIYETAAAIGGINKPLRLIVQPNIEIDIHPSEVHFVGTTPGTSHQATVICNNRGNVPLVLPEIDERKPLDGDDVGEFFGGAATTVAGRSATDFLEEFARLINKRSAATERRSLKESGQVLAPGEATNLHVTLTIPEDVPEEAEYEGEISLFNEKLLYRIVQDVPHKHRRSGPGAARASADDKES